MNETTVINRSRTGHPHLNFPWPFFRYAPSPRSHAPEPGYVTSEEKLSKAEAKRARKAAKLAKEFK